LTTAPASEGPGGDLAALARGGRTNFIGFLMRLAARLPFLFIAGRFYGADALGRFAFALVVVELIAMICTIGEKRGLAQRLSESDDNPTHLVADSLTVALMASSLAALALWFVPAPMFPSGIYTETDRLIVLAIPALALTEILLAAQAYRYDIAATVRARAIVEPWTISIMAGVLLLVDGHVVTAVDRAENVLLKDLQGPAYGLSLAYLISILAALVTAGWPFLRTYGLPRGWQPSPARMFRMTVRGLPLAAADAIEWGTRRLDLFILGLFAAPSAVGVYYVAQQVASLPQKLKTSFEPILGPVLTRKLKEKDYGAIAKQVCQVGFWITAAQAGVGLALGIPGEAIMGLVGPNFVGGTGALGFLLLAEVVAGTAVVSEAALVYVARLRNLWVSLATIGLQAALTVAAMLIADRFDFNQGWRAAAAAAALMIALAASSLVKALMLSRILHETINNWRWALVWAAAAAIVAGQLVILMPQWGQLTFGIPAILGIYGWIIWTRGFGPEDRVLFTRKVTQEEPQ
jgi:O-antigen/teichoic acid export membrane protein